MIDRNSLNFMLALSGGIVLGIFVSKYLEFKDNYIMKKLNHYSNLLTKGKFKYAISNQSTKPKNANEECVGIESPDAGKAASCVGCPNAEICASGEAKQKIPINTKNLENIKNIILILSGKGGVGKSTVSMQLSWYLSQNFNVGLLDIDICGPSIPKMAGIANHEVHMSANGWSPVYANENLAIMSTAFLLPDEDDAVIWRGPKKNGLIRQFLTDVDWGNLDFLIIDTPPGTSDEHLSIITYLQGANVKGSIIVTTPQEISLQDVRKEITFCKKVELPIIGIVENMNKVFKNVQGNDLVNEMCKKMEVDYLVTIPWDDQLLFCCEKGTSVNYEVPNSDSAREIKNLGDFLINTFVAS
ncbi:putative nucleotide-binding protein 1 [Cryptosporidium serpentis]